MYPQNDGWEQYFDLKVSPWVPGKIWDSNEERFSSSSLNGSYVCGDHVRKFARLQYFLSSMMHSPDGFPCIGGWLRPLYNQGQTGRFVIFSINRLFPCNPLLFARNWVGYNRYFWKIPAVLFKVERGRVMRTCCLSHFDGWPNRDWRVGGGDAGETLKWWLGGGYWRLGG